MLNSNGDRYNLIRGIWSLGLQFNVVIGLEVFGNPHIQHLMDIKLKWIKSSFKTPTSDSFNYMNDIFDINVSLSLDFKDFWTSVFLNRAREVWVCLSIWTPLEGCVWFPCPLEKTCTPSFSSSASLVRLLSKIEGKNSQVYFREDHEYSFSPNALSVKIHQLGGCWNCACVYKLPETYLLEIASVF